MSCNTAIMVEINKINIDDSGISILKESSDNRSEHFDVEDEIRNDYVKLTREFNYDNEKIFPILKTLEQYLISSDKAEEIGDIYDESDLELEGKIYSFRGKIFIVYFTQRCTGWMANDYIYTITSVDNINDKHTYHDYMDLEIVLINFLALLELKKVIDDCCSKTKFEFAEAADNNICLSHNVYKAIIDIDLNKKPK